MPIYSVVTVADLAPGMTVIWRGKFTTVNESDLDWSEFMGHSFRGDASRNLITRVRFFVQKADGSIRVE